MSFQRFFFLFPSCEVGIEGHLGVSADGGLKRKRNSAQRIISHLDAALSDEFSILI